eukprot:Nk52_evm6s1762 gene=Nk52_evmTU6s1762
MKGGGGGRLLLLAICILCLATCIGEASEVTLGGLFPMELAQGKEREAHFNLAIKLINDKTDGWFDDVLPTITLKGSTNDSACDGSTALGSALHQLFTVKVTGLIGAACSSASVAAALVARVFKAPQISYSSTSPVLSSAADYPYFARTVLSDDFQGLIMIEVLIKNNWKWVGLMVEDSQYGLGISNVMLSLATENSLGITFIQEVFSSTSSDEVIQSQIGVLNSKSIKIMILIANAIVAEKIVRNMAALENANELKWERKLQFILSDSTAGTTFTTAPLNVYSNFFDGAIGLRPVQSFGELSDSYLNIWKGLSSAQYFDSDGDRSTVNTYGPSTFDAVVAMAKAIHAVNLEGKDFKNGTLILEKILLSDFLGVTGPIKFNSNGDRSTGMYQIMNFQYPTLSSRGRQQRRASSDSKTWAQVGSWESTTGVVYTSPFIYVDNSTISPLDGSCLDWCNGLGSCSSNTGVCDCLDGWVGPSCSSLSPKAVTDRDTLNSIAFCEKLTYYQIKTTHAEGIIQAKLLTGYDIVSRRFDSTLAMSKNPLNVSASDFVVPTPHLVDEAGVIMQYESLPIAKEGEVIYIMVYGTGKVCPASFVIQVHEKSLSELLDSCSKNKLTGSNLVKNASTAWSSSKGGVVFLVCAVIIFVCSSVTTFIKSLKNARKYAVSVDEKITTINFHVSNFIALGVMFFEFVQYLYAGLALDSSSHYISRMRDAYAIFGFLRFEFTWWFWLVLCFVILYIVYTLIIILHLPSKISRYTMGKYFLLPSVAYLPIISSLGFMPLLLTMMESLVCTYQTDKALMMAKGMCDTECWTGVHWLYASLGFVGLVAFVNLQNLTCFFWQDIVQDLQIRYHPLYYLETMVLKALVVGAFIFFPEFPEYSSFAILALYVLASERIRRRMYSAVFWIDDIRIWIFRTCAVFTFVIFLSSFDWEVSDSLWLVALVCIPTLSLIGLGLWMWKRKVKYFHFDLNAYSEKLRTMKAFFRTDTEISSKCEALSRVSANVIDLPKMIQVGVGGFEDHQEWEEIGYAIEDWRIEKDLSMVETLLLYHIIVLRIRFLLILYYSDDDHTEFFECISNLLSLAVAKESWDDIVYTSKKDTGLAGIPFVDSIMETQEEALSQDTLDVEDSEIMMEDDENNIDSTSKASCSDVSEDNSPKKLEAASEDDVSSLERPSKHNEETISVKTTEIIDIDEPTSNEGKDHLPGGTTVE